MKCAKSFEREEQRPGDFTIESADTIGASEESCGITQGAFVRSVSLLFDRSLRGEKIGADESVMD
jgi:hypothetical protein